MKLRTDTRHHLTVIALARRWLILGLACLHGFANAQPPAYQGSLPTGQATRDILQLSLDDAIARGLKYNLGLVTSQQNARTSTADRMQALSKLLPNVSAGVQGTREQLD